MPGLFTTAFPGHVTATITWNITFCLSTPTVTEQHSATSPQYNYCISGVAISEVRHITKYDTGLKSYYATVHRPLQPYYRECVFCMKARSPVMDASFSVCLDRDKDEYVLDQRHIYKPHPPDQAGSPTTLLYLPFSLTLTLSPSHLFSPLFPLPLKCIGQPLTALCLITELHRNSIKCAFRIKAYKCYTCKRRDFLRRNLPDFFPFFLATRDKCHLFSITVTLAENRPFFSAVILSCHGRIWVWV